MKSTLSIPIILLFAIKFGQAQTKPIAIEFKSITSKANIIYRDWDNHVKISATGIPANSITLSTNHGTVTPVNDSVFSIITTEDSSKINVRFLRKTVAKTILVKSIRLSVKPVQPTALMLDGKLVDGKNTFSKSEIKEGSELKMVLDQDMLINKVILSDYEFTAATATGARVISSNSGKIIKEVKEEIIDATLRSPKVNIEGRCLTVSDKKLLIGGVIIIK